MNDYTAELNRYYTQKLRELLTGLPDFLDEFFRGTADEHGARTRLFYAYDLRLFFGFLSENSLKFAGKPLFAYELADLDEISPDDVEEYMEYLSYYVNGAVRTNRAHGKYRKLCAVRTMFTFFLRKRKIKTNPALVIKTPKLKEQPIIQLNPDEVAKLLDEVESGEKLSPAQKKYYKYTKLRDFAIITLLLGTGARVSECVGLDVNHVDFADSALRVTRKGGGDFILFFGAEVADALAAYLCVRAEISPLAGHENALFLSMQKRRITTRAVQNLVKKYSSLITNLKKITPHKLRSTFGTQLYRETGDIYLVAETLGHADVNTTRKHYAKIDEDRRRSAVKYVRLREKD